MTGDGPHAASASSPLTAGDGGVWYGDVRNPAARGRSEKQMMHVTRTIEWDMGHRVPEHCSKCRNPHGHRYRLDLTVAGKIHEEPGSAQGMVIDFAEIKRALSERVHDVLDHSFMVYEDDEAMAAFYREHPDLRHVFVPYVPTAENICRWCYEQLREALPPSVSIVRLRIFETPNCWADYLPEED